MALRQHRGKRVKQESVAKYRERLLAWYDRHRRDLPWRTRGGGAPDPYAVWLSEIMCQQTTVQAVMPYYIEFLRRWPTVFDLAVAPEDEIMAAWAGLGYYARARNLHRCAGIVSSALGGRFPDNQDELGKLPGIGEYTAAAIAAIAFGRPATVVDGNVERIMARFFAVSDPVPGAKKALKELASRFFEDFKERPGDLAQAFMDLGAGICIPKAPRCDLCPLKEGCRGLREGTASGLPARAAKAEKPQRYGNVYWLEYPDGRVLFQRRPKTGLLGGMTGLPTSEWALEKGGIRHPPLPGICGGIKDTGIQAFHTFTHFNLTLFLYRGNMAEEGAPINDERGFYPGEPEQEIKKMPSVFRKTVRWLFHGEG